MQATTYKMSAASLETMPPEIGMPRFAKGRIFIRVFPKNEAEAVWFEYLHALMRASPKYQQSTKAKLEKYCRQQFDVTVESFRYCWREAIEHSKACWNKQGRRRRKNDSD